MRRWLALLLLLALAGSAAAESVADEQRALVAAKRDAAAANARAAALERAAADAKDQARAAKAAAAALGQRLRSAEADIAAAEARVRLVEAAQARQRARLATRQGPLTRVAAALQIMARRPTALSIAQPGSIADAVHVRALLAASIPTMRARTAALRAELAEAGRLAQAAALAASTLREGRVTLEQRRQALAALERRHRARSTELAGQAIGEQDRAAALGERARDIVDRMEEIGVEAELTDKLVTLRAPAPRPMLAGLPAGAAPPVPAPPGYRLPVTGRVMTGYGEVAESGISARGLTLAVTPGAAVDAPAAGRIAYAGQFRHYGAIVIVDHGGGWTTLVTGLAATRRVAGETALPGGEIGVAAASGRVTVELRRGAQAQDLAAVLAAAGG